MAIAATKPGFPGGWGGLALAGAAALFAVSCIPGRSPHGLVPVGTGPGRVIGILVVNAPPRPGTAAANEIELPDAKVFLVDASGNRAAEALTRLDGRFDIRAPAPGQYRLCYEIGALSGCAQRGLALGSTVLTGPVAVAAGNFISGRVLNGDGRPCWMADSFFGLDVSTSVSAIRAGGGGPPQARTRANVQGEYALFGLNPGRYEVTAQCEEARTNGVASLGTRPTVRDLSLSNHAPELRTVAAFAATRRLARAAPGTTIELRSTAIDRDGDTIQYMWRTPDGNDPAAGSAATAHWRLPAEEGLASVYLMARDGHGGFAYQRVDLEGARSERIGISGRAIDEATGAPVRGASVTFGSASGRTDASGWFQLEAEPRESGRYVLNIRHPDYALVSRVLERGARGDSYELTPMQAGSVAAGGPIRLIDRASGNLCGNPVFLREQAMARSTGPQPFRLSANAIRDEQGQERQSARERPAALRCMTRGAEVALPAGALVNDRGAAAAGVVRTTVATLNPARRALPGDYSALPRGGGGSALLSFGAIDVRFADAGGRPLNLRPGAAAEIRIPVDPAQSRVAPPTMKMWSYDEENGHWIEEGSARLVQTGDGAFYVGETRHFSAINMDLELNVANATCVRFRVDAAFGAWTPLTMRAYVTYANGTSSQTAETVLDTSQYHSIRALPYATGNTLLLELRGTLNGSPQVVYHNIFQLGPPRSQMTASQLFPPDPYVGCDDLGLLAPQAALPDYGAIDAAGRPAFLGGPFGDFNPPTSQAAIYYATADPGNLRTTLGAWWAVNGFDANGQGGTNTSFTEAAYMNHNDLGFGRDMHCIEPGGGRLACYVTNYGLPDQNSQNANDAASHNPLTRGATVTMEYDPNAANNANVQFYVYNGGVAAAQRIPAADLDGFGPKPVPHLCTVCHGGAYDGDNGTIIGSHLVRFARFREFDLPSFRYLNGQSWNYGDPNPAGLGLDANAFARLNNMVHTAHPGTPIGSLITAWYPNGFAGGPLPVLPNPPTGWSQPQDIPIYHSVYGRSCRTCHIARDAPNNVVFDTAAAFKFTDYFVCGGTAPKIRRMPNAFITYRNFWADAQRVADYETFLGVSNCGS